MNFFLLGELGGFHLVWVIELQLRAFAVCMKCEAHIQRKSAGKSADGERSN